jgi:bacterioferritin-associated ferredoxin
LHGICYKAPVSAEDPYVCLCLAVRESEIKAAIAGGADTVARIGGMCEAGSACQSCHPQLRELLREHAAAQLARSQAPESLHQLSLFDELQGARRPSTPTGSHVGRSKSE